MKKFIYLFALVISLVVVFSSCAKFPDDQIAPTGNDIYQLKLKNATLSGDTVIVPLNTLEVFTFEKAGVAILADFNFKNATPIVTGIIVATKFITAGVYSVTGTDLSVTPNVTKTKLVKAVKEIVIPKSENAIIVISSSFTTAGLNTMTLGLKCTAIGGFDPLVPIAGEVQYEMKPSISWTAVALPVSSIQVVNGIKYYTWTFTALNNQKIRFGWLAGDSWAYDSKSIFRQADGLYVLYVNNGAIAKEVLTSSLPGSFGDIKVRGDLEIISGAQNIVLYFQKVSFSGGTPTLKFKVGTTAEQTIVLADAGDYYVAKVAMLNAQEINFWPLSSVGTVNISDSIVWNADKLSGRIQVINLKSATMGGVINQPSVILG